MIGIFVYILLPLTVVMVPVFVYLCKRRRIFAFWKVFGLGMAWYTATAVVVGAVLSLTSFSPGGRALEKVGFWAIISGYGIAIYAAFYVPLVLAIAFVMHRKYAE